MHSNCSVTKYAIRNKDPNIGFAVRFHMPNEIYCKWGITGDRGLSSATFFDNKDSAHELFQYFLLDARERGYSYTWKIDEWEVVSVTFEIFVN